MFFYRHPVLFIIFLRKPVGVRVFVSLDGLTYTEVKHTGSIPGEISLEATQVLKYIRLVMVEDQTDPDLNTKPLGVRFIEMSGCPGKDDLEPCSESFTRLSTDGKAYRHIG